MSKAHELLRYIAYLSAREGARDRESLRWRLVRYGVAVTLTLLAWGVSLMLGSELGAPSLPFAAAVALATWFGGSGPGLLTSVLSIIAIDFSFLPPVGAIELTHSEDLIDIVVFLVVALTIGGTTAALRRARNHLAVSHADAERLAAQAQRLLDVTAALAEAGSVDEVADVILTKGTSAVEATRAFLMLVDGDSMERLGAIGYGEDMRQRTRLTNIDDDGPLAEAIRTRSAIWLSTGEEFRERYPRVYARVGAVSDRQAHVVAPLRYGNEVVGALGMSFAEPSAIGAADRAFTLLLAQSAAAALQRARSYDAEREKRREAELTARGREQVLGVVAHDLRNPLHLIMATGELLDDPHLATDRRRELVAMTMRAASHMRRLVSDLLDAVRIQSGQLTLDYETMTLGAIVDQAEEMCRPLAADRHIQLNAHATNRALRVRVDRGRIQQALGNLLGNAIKFTAEGGRVSLDTTVERGNVTFKVIDSGAGIAPERLPHVFEQFWQGKKSDGRGVGLGLAIAKAIVEAHLGTIEVESVVGKGTTFSITLPTGAAVEAFRSEAGLEPVSAR